MLVIKIWLRGREKTLVLDIYNFISPNGDGKNDTWYIDDLSVFDGQEAHLRIYDRYGNLMFEDKSKTKFKWNGKRTGKSFHLQIIIIS